MADFHQGSSVQYAVCSNGDDADALRYDLILFHDEPKQLVYDRLNPQHRL